MKIKNKLLFALAPAAAVSTIVPITITSCGKSSDIETLSESTHELSEGLISYSTGDIYFQLSDKYAFTDSEKEGKTIHFTLKNLKWNDKVTLDASKTEPTITYSEGTWGKDTSTKKYDFYSTKISVYDCTLATGAEITFDLIGQFGKVEGTTFTGISSSVNFGNWKLTF